MSDKLQNLLVRGASGVVLFGVVLGAAFLGYWGFGALMLLITVVGVWEFYQLAMAKGAMPQRCMGIVTSILLLVTAFSAILLAVPCVESVVGECLPFVLLATIAAFALIFFVEVFRNKENPTQNIASTIMGVIYVALPMSLMLFIPCMLSPDKWNPWIFLSSWCGVMMSLPTWWVLASAAIRCVHVFRQRSRGRDSSVAFSARWLWVYSEPMS